MANHEPLTVGEPERHGEALPPGTQESRGLPRGIHAGNGVTCGSELGAARVRERETEVESPREFRERSFELFGRGPPGSGSSFSATEARDERPVPSVGVSQSQAKIQPYAAPANRSPQPDRRARIAGGGEASAQ